MWKKVISLLLVLCMLITTVGCFGNPVVPDGSYDEDVFIIKVTDPESNIVVITGEEEGDVIGVFGEKDDSGNLTEVTGAIYISEQGDIIEIVSGKDGLIELLIDSEGNKVVYENYTSSTVDISIYDSSGDLIQGPTTIEIDPEEVLNLTQLYNSINSKNRIEGGNTLEALKWGLIGLKVVSCVGSILFGAVPAVLLLCGSAVISIASEFTENDVDNAFATGMSTGECVVGTLSLDPGAVIPCAEAIIGTVELVEELNESVNHDPVISSLIANPSSININETTTITCTASDQDGDNLTYNWIKILGIFEGSLSGPTIIWKAPSTTGSYYISCEVRDGEGGEDSELVEIVVTNPEEGNEEVVLESIDVLPNNMTIEEGDYQSVSSITAYYLDGSFKNIALNNSNLTYYSSSSLVAEVNNIGKVSAKSEGITTVTVYYNEGKSVDDSIEITVTKLGQGNHAPVVSSVIANPNPVEGGKNTTITCSASDQDGDNLTYSWTKNGEPIGWNDSSIIWKAPTTNGTYNIVCVVSDGKKEDSGSVNVVVNSSPDVVVNSSPDKPTLYDPGSVACSGDSYTVSWSDCSSSGATRYRIQESTDTYFNTIVSDSYVDVTKTSKSFSHETSSSIVTYYYRVRSENQDNGLNSLWSNEEHIDITPYCSPLGKPTIYDPGPPVSKETSYSISWTTVENAQGYYLFESTSPSGGGTPIYVTSTSKIFNHNEITEDTTYYYTVQAYNEYIGTGPTSNQVSKTVKLKMLEDLTVTPLEMNLNVGESKYFESITLWYSDDSTKNMSLSDPNLNYYSIRPEIATVNNSGKITGVSPGDCYVGVEYTEEGVTVSDAIDVTVN